MRPLEAEIDSASEGDRAPGALGSSSRLDLVRPFASLGLGDIALVGGKNASLGEMVRELAGAGVPVPDGFAITATAYRLVLERAGIVRQLAALLAGLDPANVADLTSRAAQARRLVAGAELPGAPYVQPGLERR